MKPDLSVLKDMQFQSTLSVRRATEAVRYELAKLEISIHALRKESDTRGWLPETIDQISIHALRKESDILASMDVRAVMISIHALRKESDRKVRSLRLPNTNFNPRSP